MISDRNSEHLLRAVSFITLFITSVACHCNALTAAENDGRKTAEGSLSQSVNDKSAVPDGKKNPVTAKSFIQQVHVPFPVSRILPNGDVHQLTILGSQIYAASSSGILHYMDGSWKTVHRSSSPVRILTSSEKELWFVEGDFIFSRAENTAAEPRAALSASTDVSALLAVKDQIFVGTRNGLFRIESGQLTEVKAVNQLLGTRPDIRQLSHHDSQLAIAAMNGLITFDVASGSVAVETPTDGDESWAPRDVRGVAFDDSGDLWFASPQGVGHRTDDGWKLTGRTDGIPWNDFTCIAAADSSHGVWFGTNKGAVRFHQGNWEYRQGPRWLLNDQVRSISLTESGDAWFSTPAGISLIEARKMTLARKSEIFNEAIDRHHKRTEYGFVDAVTLKSPEDLSEVSQHDSDNDGLWTSMYGAAQCFEYASTKSASSRQRASSAFRAVAFLSEVPQGSTHSPPPGFPARSILPVSGRNPNERDNPEHDRHRQKSDPLWKVLTPRWPVSADGKWYWKTDTSSDELDGHYFFYALYHDLVAETEAEKKSVRDVVNRITSHLLDHNYSLVDHDGKPTRWGQFAPDVLNTDRLTDCRGLNSLSILSYLLVAEHVTGDPKYRKAYLSLLYDHNYFTNILNPKAQNGPGSGNQSDDEMAFMCYYNVFRYEKDPTLRRQFMRSFARYFANEAPEACPLFNYVFAAFWEPLPYLWPSVPPQFLSDSLDTLQRFPLDRRQWSFQNGHRLDIIPLGSHIIEADGKGFRRDGKVVPIDERNINHWNQDPWRLDGSGNGHELADGTAFLLPYWMGVYHGFTR